MEIFNNPSLFWIFVLIISIVLEVFTQSLVSIWFAISAFVLVIVSVFSIPYIIQLSIFIGIAFVLLIFTRPFVEKKLKVKNDNLNSIVGQKVVLIEAIENNKKGSFKINGVTWSAMTEDFSSADSGKECIVTQMKGNTAIVKIV